MSAPQRPREWLIKPATNVTDPLILDSDFELFPGWKDSDYIHVIEYSAYEALEAENKRLREALKLCVNIDCYSCADIAREALENKK